MSPTAETFVSLMYHNVCELPACGGTWPGFENLSPSITDYFVDGGTFASHCELIANSGNAMRADEFRATSPTASRPIAGRSRSSAAPRVLVTFDDGWRGTVDVAGPILASHGLHALLFVTTDLIGNPRFVDRTQLRELSKMFEIGSHARSHRLLAGLSDDEVRAELNDSKSLLEDLLDRDVDMIAYPGGSFDHRVLRMTRQAGYRLVFTSQPIVNDWSSAASCIGRLAVKRGTSNDTIERWLRGDVRQERLRAFGLRATKHLLGRSAYRRLRSRLIAEDVAHLEMTDLAGSGRMG
ncbi:MAG: polysaccharide deacetylase family protein [Planctomycetaceae bacterium]